MNQVIAEKAAKSWFPYFYSRLAIVGSSVLLFYTYNNIKSLENGEVERIQLWNVSSHLYELGGLWLALAPLALALLSAIYATIRYRTTYLSLRGQVSDEEFKLHKRKIEQRKADESHIFGGKKTSAKQFLIVLLAGLTIAFLCFIWLVNNV